MSTEVPRAWLLDRWTASPEDFAEEIFFRTEPEELEEIMRVLKKTNRPAYKYLQKDFLPLWRLLLKSEDEIRSYIVAKNLSSHIEYFISICKRGNKKDLREYRRDLTKEEFARSEEVNNRNVENNGWSKLIRVFEQMKREQKKESSPPPDDLGDFAEYVNEQDRFFKFETRLKSKDFFSIGLTPKRLAAWGVYLIEKGIVKRPENKPGGNQKGAYNGARFCKYLTRRAKEAGLAAEEVEKVFSINETTKRAKALTEHVNEIEKLLAEGS